MTRFPKELLLSRGRYPVGITQIWRHWVQAHARVSRFPVRWHRSPHGSASFARLGMELRHALLMAYLVLPASVFQAPYSTTYLAHSGWHTFARRRPLYCIPSFHSRTMKGIPSPPMRPFFGCHLPPGVDIGPKRSVLADRNHCLLATNTHRPFLSMRKHLGVFTK
jgi:hypothetical protein